MRSDDSLKRARAVIFDCDGLLLDTEELWMRGEAALVERYGVKYTPQVRARLFGMSAKDLVPELEALLDRPGEGTALVEELVASCWVEISRDATPRPGALDLVRSLWQAPERPPLGVASNSPRGLVEEALATAGLAGAFDAVIGYDDVRDPKPAPEPYLLCCERLGAEPRRSVALEDSPTGVASARAAGMYVIGVPSVPDIPLDAHHVADSLKDPAISSVLRLP